LDCWIKQQKNSYASPLGLKNHPSSDLQFFGALTTKKHGIYLRAIWKSSGALYGIISRGMGMEKIGDPNPT